MSALRRSFSESVLSSGSEVSSERRAGDTGVTSRLEEPDDVSLLLADVALPPDSLATPENPAPSTDENVSVLLVCDAFLLLVSCAQEQLNSRVHTVSMYE